MKVWKVGSLIIPAKNSREALSIYRRVKGKYKVKSPKLLGTLQPSNNLTMYTLEKVKTKKKRKRKK